MMYSFPFFPHFYTRPYYHYPQSSTGNVNYSNVADKNFSNNIISNKTSPNDINNKKNNFSKNYLYNKIIHKNFSKGANFSGTLENTKSQNSESVKTEDAIFEIFGIKLHYDDILLICLIFFLYKEGVKDEFLFLVLILLLIS